MSSFETQKATFKKLQGSVAKQSPATQRLLEVCESIVDIFCQGLLLCENEMSFCAITFPVIENDEKGIKLDALVYSYINSIGNCFKYDHSDVSDLFDLDHTTESTDEGTELWLHARRKFRIE